METSLAGLLSIFYVGYLSINRRLFFERVLIFCIIIELFVEIGYVVKVDNWVFPISRFVEDVLGFYCIFRIGSCRIKLRNRWLFLSAVYIIPIFVLIAFPSDVEVANAAVSWDAIIYDGEKPQHPAINLGVIMMTVRFILYASIIIQIIHRYSFEEFKLLLFKIKKFCFVFLCLGIFEFIFKNFLGGNDIWGTFIELFFGTTDDTVLSGRVKSNTFELCMFTKESSHYAYVLILMALFFLTNSILNNKKIISPSLIGCLFLLFFSTAFSSLLFIIYFALILIIYRWYVMKPKTVTIEKLACISLIVITVLSVSVIDFQSENPILKRLLNLITNFEQFTSSTWDYGDSLGDVSTQVRLISVIQTIIVFLRRPICGYSFNTVACHGATAMFLAGVGIIGLWAWVRYYYYHEAYDKCICYIKKPYALTIILYLFFNLLNSIWMRPFYEITPFLMSICFKIIYSKQIISSLQNGEKQSKSICNNSHSELC